MTDDRGVLGNLPNSRPGRRSSKRPAAPQAQQQAAPPRKPPARPTPAEPVHQESDPVGNAIRTATGLAGAGARVANDVARQLVRRLPRI